MNIQTPVSTDTQSGGSQPAYLKEQSQSNRWVKWWLGLVSPPEPLESASFEEREIFRRGQTASYIMLVQCGLLLASLPVVFNGGSLILDGMLAATPFILWCAALLNRSKRVTFAGALLLFAAEGIPITNLLTSHGGLSPFGLPVFTLLVMPLMISVSVLPSLSVFAFAAFNCIFMYLELTLFPRTAEMIFITHVALSAILVPLLLSQIVVACVGYIWVHNAGQALKRADRAEEIAKLQHDLAQQSRMEAEQKQKLEISIQKIVETHTRAANGDISARVPLTKDNLLWQISGSLNNLLARLQRSLQDAQESIRLRHEVRLYREENARLRTALQAQIPSQTFALNNEQGRHLMTPLPPTMNGRGEQMHSFQSDERRLR